MVSSGMPWSEVLEAEADDRRRRERDEQWEREGIRLSWAEYVAGEPCRGCGLPMTNELGSWPPLMKLSEAEKREYEEADQEFRERYTDCRDARWTVNGSRYRTRRCHGNRHEPAHVRGIFGHPPAAPVCAA